MYKYSEKSMHAFPRTCVYKIMSTDGRQTDTQTDGRTDRLIPIYHPNFVCGGGGGKKKDKKKKEPPKYFVN